MQERAPQFPHRPPTPLPPWAVLFFTAQIGLLCVYHVVSGLFGAQSLSVALHWGLFSIPFYLLLLAAPPLLKPLLGRGSPQRDWWIYAGVYGGLALGASILRSLIAPWATGVAIPPEVLRSLAGSMLVTLFISIAGMEALASRIVFQQNWQRESARRQRELAESRSQLVTTDDLLRREAAEYLHGEIQSRLLMAWAFLDQARGEAEQRQALIQEARIQLSTLRHEGLDHARLLLGLTDRPLSERIDELIARFRTVIPVSVERDPPVTSLERGLPSELRAAALYMVEEGLLNAFRHAGASRIVVRLASAPSGSLTISVQDDGSGFDPRSHAKGLGLSGLGTALEAQGGSWKLDSAPGRGTTLSLALPLRSVHQREAA
ncbi:Sensor histidine kinase LiaS [compost metagenome]